jgi:hypothetical protein
MKGLKKLALATAVLAVSTGAFAMEAMQDEAMSNTTGQDGLSILQSGLNVNIGAIRYTDNDGFTGASTALGIVDIPAVFAAKTLVDSFTSAGTVHIKGLSISATSILTTIDVGSTGTTGADTTGLLIGSTITNLSVNLGNISFDNGTELSSSSAGVSSAANAGGNNIGGIALSHISLPSQSAMLITAGAASLPNGATSGITITPLMAIADLHLVVGYYNTSLATYTGAGSYAAPAGDFSPVGAGVAGDGVITLPIDITGILQGPTQIAAGLKSSGYGITNNQGLEIAMGHTVISSIDIGAQNGAVPSTGINITGTTVGSVGIIGLDIAASQLNISGH